jgi:hypothetical protein
VRVVTGHTRVAHARAFLLARTIERGTALHTLALTAVCSGLSMEAALTSHDVMLCLWRPEVAGLGSHVFGSRYSLLPLRSSL